MIDINNTLDLVKLKLYNEWLYTAHIYDEGASPMHESLTKEIITKYIDPLNLAKDAKIPATKYLIQLIHSMHNKNN
jgi:hypothetical protein